MKRSSDSCTPSIYFKEAKVDEARKELAWVSASGDHAIDEFVLVSVYSKKMENKRSGGSTKSESTKSESKNNGNSKRR